jgi:hypothetical protein
MRIRIQYWVWIHTINDQKLGNNLFAENIHIKKSALLLSQGLHEACPYLLLGAMCPVLHVEGLRTLPGICVVGHQRAGSSL